MSTEQAGAVVIQVTAGDFERLWENSGKWADLTDTSTRFETLDDDRMPPSWTWQRIYWLGNNYAAVIFARTFLAARGFDYEILYDTEEDPEGRPFGYVILTDYEETR